MWICIVLIFIVVVGISVVLVYVRYYRDKDVGKKFFEESEKPFGKKAPAIYYHKQRLYRLYYGLFSGVHYFLLVSSVVFTIITIYIVIDNKLSQTTRITVSVIAAISTTLQTILRFDKIAEGYICAMRILEQAILEFEHSKASTLVCLLKANKEAEEKIHNMFQ